MTETYNRNLLIFFFLLFLISFGIYYPSFNGPYMLDDFHHIVNNTALHITTLNLENIKNSPSTYVDRPISMITLALNYYLFGPSPFSFKFLNFIIHFVNFILIFFLTKKILLINKSYSKKYIIFISLMVSSIWLLHPYNLSTVSYVIQRMTLLSSMFSICSLISYINFRKYLSNKNIKKSCISFSLVTLFSVLAFFTKEIGALIIVYILLLEISFFIPLITPESHRNLVYRLMLGTSVGVLIFLLYVISNSYMMNGYEFRVFSLQDRLLTEPRIIFQYISNIILPSLNSMSLYQDSIAISKDLFTPFTTILSIISLGLIFVTILIMGPKYKLLGFGLLTYFSSHLIESSVIPLELAFEHRNYFASYGMLLFLVVLFVKLNIRKIFKQLLFVLYILLLSATLLFRSLSWSNDIAFHNSQLNKKPESYRANFFAAQYLETQPGQESKVKSILVNLSYMNKYQIESLVLLLDNRYASADEVKDIENEIAYRLKVIPMEDKHLHELLKLINCHLITKACRTTSTGLVNILESLLENNTLGVQKQNYVGMIRANILINSLGNCEDGYPISKSIYDRFMRIDKSKPQSFIIQSHSINKSRCN
jgi:protein O-mannosyl-transferase